MPLGADAHGDEYWSMGVVVGFHCDVDQLRASATKRVEYGEAVCGYREEREMNGSRRKQVSLLNRLAAMYS